MTGNRYLALRVQGVATFEFIPRPCWFDQANCRGTDPGLFHPSRGDAAQSRQARAICATCPVCGPCLEYALTHGEHWGIWGGTSERQRRAMKGRT